MKKAVKRKKRSKKIALNESERIKIINRNSTIANGGEAHLRDRRQ